MSEITKNPLNNSPTNFSGCSFENTEFNNVFSKNPKNVLFLPTVLPLKEEGKDNAESLWYKIISFFTNIRSYPSEARPYIEDTINIQPKINVDANIHKEVEKEINNKQSKGV